MFRELQILPLAAFVARGKYACRAAGRSASGQLAWTLERVETSGIQDHTGTKRWTKRKGRFSRRPWVTSEAADKAVTESVGGSTFLQDEIKLLDSACLDLERVQAKVSSFFCKCCGNLNI